GGGTRPGRRGLSSEGSNLPPDSPATVAHVTGYGEDVSGHDRPGIHRHVAVYGGEISLGSSGYIRVAPGHGEGSLHRLAGADAVVTRAGLTSRHGHSQCRALESRCPAGETLALHKIASVAE